MTVGNARTGTVLNKKQKLGSVSHSDGLIISETFIKLSTIVCQKACREKDKAPQQPYIKYVCTHICICTNTFNMQMHICLTSKLHFLCSNTNNPYYKNEISYCQVLRKLFIWLLQTKHKVEGKQLQIAVSTSLVPIRDKDSIVEKAREKGGERYY